MVKAKITQTMPYDKLITQGLEFIDGKDFGKIPTGSPQYGRQIEVG